MPRALILGGTGCIGSATAARLLAAGWDVDVTGRNPDHLETALEVAGARFLGSDRGDAAALAGAMGTGADLLVDCLCYTADDATRLVPLLADARSTVMVSTKAVYVDDAGNHSNSASPPSFGGPIRESNATLPAGSDDHTTAEGYGRNKVAAEAVLLSSGAPVTVIRPSKVHGVGAAPPREWVFVKRVLDRRRAVLLARGGTGVDHTTAAANLAALVEVVAGAPGRRVLNCADPDAPSAAGIARTVARLLGHDWAEVRLDAAAPAGLGRTPWDAPHPIVLDMGAARELGYVPVGDYASTVAAEVAWLASSAAGDASRVRPDDSYFAPFFDYDAEDAYLRTL